jgi:hypothetical protein
MLEGLSKREVAVWTISLAVAVALMTLGSIYLVGSMLTADASQTHAKQGTQTSGPPAVSS